MAAKIEFRDSELEAWKRSCSYLSFSTIYNGTDRLTLNELQTKLNKEVWSIERIWPLLTDESKPGFQDDWGHIICTNLNCCEDVSASLLFWSLSQML